MKVRPCGKKVAWKVTGDGMKEVYLCEKCGKKDDINRLVKLTIIKRWGSYDEGEGCMAEVRRSEEKEGATPG